GRHDAAAAGTMIEIFEDHAGIEQHRAVLEHERRDLAERVLLANGVARAHGVGRLDGDLALEPEHGGGDPHLADERRGWRAAKCQHGIPVTMRVERSMIAPTQRGAARGQYALTLATTTIARVARRGPPASAGHDEIDGLRALALLVGLDVEGDVLSLIEPLEPGALDRGDVNEHVAAAAVGFDEPVAALGVEELDDTCHGHRETPFPVVARRRAPAARRLRLDIHKRGSSGPIGLRHSAGPHWRRNVKASPVKIG